MIYLLLLFSFIIHIVTLIIIRQMKINQQNLLDIEDNVNEQINKLEDTLALYLVEMREENDNFTKELFSMQNKQKRNEQVSDGTKDNKNQSDNIENASSTDTHIKKNDYPDFEPLTQIDKKDIVEQSETGQILHLYNNGYSIEEIAKRMDKGKTEIELLLKFQQKNQ
ncbi:DUF6115 domain-containing protein [Gracilibacillus xinjiangensis]|uniref:DUF6115 domain-containing protein n=1 Tax=Gracilibacillus xinjiangensis TaxID=1193282 RepID=A0ABV8WZ22_9BACI